MLGGVPPSRTCVSHSAIISGMCVEELIVYLICSSLAHSPRTFKCHIIVPGRASSFLVILACSSFVVIFGILLIVKADSSLGLFSDPLVGSFLFYVSSQSL